MLLLSILTQSCAGVNGKEKEVWRSSLQDFSLDAYWEYTKYLAARHLAPMMHLHIVLTKYTKLQIKDIL